MNKSSLCQTAFVWMFPTQRFSFLRKRQPSDLSSIPVDPGESLSWFTAVQCPSALYVWLSGAQPHWLPDLFGICWSHWFSSPVPPNVHYTGIPGEERKQPDRHTPTLPGRFNYYDKPTFPQLVGNEKWKLIWRKRGWVFRGGGGDLPPPPNRRDERGDGRRAVHRRRNVRFISEVCAGSFAVLHIRRWWIIEELWAYQLFTLRKMEESWQNVLIVLLAFQSLF